MTQYSKYYSENRDRVLEYAHKHKNRTNAYKRWHLAVKKVKSPEVIAKTLEEYKQALLLDPLGGESRKKYAYNPRQSGKELSADELYASLIEKVELTEPYKLEIKLRQEESQIIGDKYRQMSLEYANRQKPSMVVENEVTTPHAFKAGVLRHH